MRDSMKPITILMADDSDDDRFLARAALKESHVLNDLREVEDGQELLDYLKRRDRYSDSQSSPLPGLILLDLNMPRMNGREALQEIKADPRLRRIPIVVLTTSDDENDIIQSYDHGVSSFITKPVSFESLVEVMRTLGRYWIEIVATPHIEEE